jgi:Protein of unknown function (DUF3617)
MGRTRVTAFGLAVLALSGSPKASFDALGTAVVADTPHLRPGQYEKTTAMTIAGRGSPPPRKSLMCVTADDIKDFSKKLSARPQQDHCTVADYKESSGAVSYTQTCTLPDGSRATAKANLTFSSDESFRAVIEMSSSGGQAAAAPGVFQGSTITVTARRIGECR